jgi:3-isopropylmalate/(R)-2-methylmalate dehydratase small subunit
MNNHGIIEGIAAPLPLPNLDTDQIMPKQFLRGIDKVGLDRGVLHDLRFDTEGKPRENFILNRPEYRGAPILIGGPNFGCGSSREHAVWGLRQLGIRAVIASGFGEIFYSNAMNNGLMLATIPEDKVQALLEEARTSATPLKLRIDVANLHVSSLGTSAGFALSPRHQAMFLHGLDMLGASLKYEQEIWEFAQRRHARQPWLKDVAAATRARLGDAGAGT